MKISIASDHAGFELKSALITMLTQKGHTLIDEGTDDLTSVDYPDFAQRVGEAIREGRAKKGILICKTGIGMSMSANKIPGIRAALVRTAEDACLCRAHNDANVICLGGLHETPDKAIEFLEIFLKTHFEGNRHAQRVQKMSQLEV